MEAVINPVTFIRKQVFRCETQEAFADRLGTSQASVSRWEAKGRIPGPAQELVREKARSIGEWNDAWFFDAPAAADRIPSKAERVA